MNAGFLVHLLLLGGISLCVVLATIPVARRIAVKFNAIDYPSARRVNKKPMPRMGGIAMFFGVSVALLIELVGETFFSWNELSRSSRMLSVNYLGVMFGLLVVTFVGAVDDVRSLKPLTKFLGQIAGAVVIAVSGVLLSSIKNPFGFGFIEFGWFAYPLTVFYLVAFMNVINLVDGLDGLAAGITAIASLTLLLIAVGRFRMETALLSVVLLGATLGFLRYNFPPASIFMGDSGSLFLGAMLGLISLLGVMRTPTLLVLAASLVIAAIPISDAFAAIVRRIRKHRPIQEADAEHLHHRLLKRGFSQKTSVLIVYAWTGLLAIGAILMSNTSGLYAFAVFISLAAISFCILWRLGIVEPVLRHHYHKRNMPSRKSTGDFGVERGEDLRDDVEDRPHDGKNI